MHESAPQLHDFLIRSAERLPSKIAVTCRGRNIGYAELDKRSNAFAWALQRRGVLRGDRVGVLAENGIDAAVAFWGALKANAVASMISPETRADKLAYLLHDARASALVADASLAAVFEGAVAKSPHLRALFVLGEAEVPNAVTFAEACGAERHDAPPPRANIDIDLAAILYTSGSTGHAKGVMLTHRNMITAAESIRQYLGKASDDVVLSVLPLAFDYGLYQLILCATVGARLVLERSFAYPGEILRLLREERVTGFPGVPTMFAVLSELRGLDPADFAGVRYVTNTAAALSPKHVRRLSELFPQARIFSMYGLTECKRCTYLPPEDLARKPGSVGIAIPNTEMWIADPSGIRLGPNQVGELVIRGATVMKGYWEKPAATAEKLRPGPLPGELVLYTGDYCRMDEEGYLYFVGRKDDVFKSRGEKVAPKEVETAIVGIEGVREAAVIGVPDDLLGCAVKAFVVLEQGAVLGEKDVQRECRRVLEPFMVPKTVAFLDELPRTSTGKIKKTDLV